MFEGVIFFKAASFVKWHNTKLTNISCFTPLFVRGTDLTVLYWILHFSLPPPTIFRNLCLLKFPGSLPRGSSEGPFGVGLFSDGTALFLSLLESTTSPHSMIQFLVTLWRNFLYFCFLVPSLNVLYIRNKLNKAQFGRNNTTFFDHFTVFLTIK
jgi:hypothetical protein